ncbi:MAG TPA: hypothetical protein VGD76_18870, partial [Ramlibacter sp.]
MREPGARSKPAARKDSEPSEFLDYLKKGAVLGAVLILVVGLLPWRMAPQRGEQQAAPVATAPQPPAQQPRQPLPQAAPPGDGKGASPLRLADFRGEQPTHAARLMADWVVATRDHKHHAFVIIDKKDARVYVFAPDGRLKDSAPALLGSARGDDSFPGIGEKPLAQIRPEEKTTPAGRFVAEPGRNTSNEEVVWVDYDAAVSMHRIRPLVAKERRLERLASLTVDDNRISFGCVNLPVSFYEDVLSPTVRQSGAIVYVLPEVKSLQQVFGAYDVRDPRQLAAHAARAQAQAGAAPV